ncbi:MAG: hypothetical protein ABIW82_00770 [Dokdonella sp.]
MKKWGIKESDPDAAEMVRIHAENFRVTTENLLGRWRKFLHVAEIFCGDGVRMRLSAADFRDRTEKRLSRTHPAEVRSQKSSFAAPWNRLQTDGKSTRCQGYQCEAADLSQRLHRAC